MNTEGRVIHVFELIAHRKIEIALNPGNAEEGEIICGSRRGVRLFLCSGSSIRLFIRYAEIKSWLNTRPRVSLPGDANGGGLIALLNCREVCAATQAPHALPPTP